MAVVQDGAGAALGERLITARVGPLGYGVVWPRRQARRGPWAGHWLPPCGLSLVATSYKPAMSARMRMAAMTIAATGWAGIGSPVCLVAVAGCVLEVPAGFGPAGASAFRR